MMREVADELNQRGHKVSVVTSQPEDYLSADLMQKVQTEVSFENGVRVIRIKRLHAHKANYIMRGLAEISMQHRFQQKANKYIKEKVDAVIVYTPPLPLAMVGSKIKKKYNARYLLNVQDIFPQNAIDLGIIKNGLIKMFFEWMEKRAYEEADKITAHSENNMKFLIDRKGVPEEKITSLWNWIDLTPYTSIERKGLFRKRYGLENKFIFLFGGIMGPSQHLDFILQVAKELIEIEDICFLLVGDGSEKERLQKIAQSMSLKNVIFQPLVSKEEYPFLVKDADVGLACLSNKNRTPVYPGKILSYMAASIPIVAFLNSQSDGHHIIKEAKCGYSMLSNGYKKAAELIMKVYNEKESLDQYGRNGFNYAKTYFSKEACMDKLEELVQW